MVEKRSGTNRYHIKANASFTIREGWLTKGLRHVAANPDIFIDETNAVRQLGVGSAMVKSMRYWMQATGLSTEPRAGKRSQTLTDLGQLIIDKDLYFEDFFTLCLIHYNLVKEPYMATVWYLLFNNFNAQRFTKDNLTSALLAAYKEMTQNTISEASFRDDCVSALKTYVAEVNRNVSPEDNMQCPLATLDLFIKTAKNSYERSMPSPRKLHPLMVLYVIADQMKKREGVAIEALLNEAGNVGQVFHLNAYRLNSYLDQLQASGHLIIQRTAGLNMVYLKKEMSPLEIAKEYYRRGE